MSALSGPLTEAATKFRIRVGNEQIALPLGVTLIGRDATCCRITIFDTLISRKHARIQCDGERATVEDLGSRNGTRLNSVSISGPHAVRDGDRIGIGSYELVVGLVDLRGSEWDSPTGLIRICPDCQMAYSASVPVCPSCGSTAEGQNGHLRSDDTTRGRWSLGMLLEMLGKSMLTARPAEVEKLMRQVVNIVSDQLRDEKQIDPDELRALGEVAAWLDKAQKGSGWSKWMADTTAQLTNLRRTKAPPR
ncbi:MAG: Adenylate cyclase [Myxococcaceae bacterium]|nr:Adenylate cyclase [Myxococcaceae bacterium]